MSLCVSALMNFRNARRPSCASSFALTSHITFFPLAQTSDPSLHIGTIRVNPMRPTDAYVTVDAFDRDVVISGVLHRNRAFEGDKVLVQLLPKVRI